MMSYSSAPRSLWLAGVWCCRPATGRIATGCEPATGSSRPRGGAVTPGIAPDRAARQQ
jgi:hypothetical protein